MKNFSFTQKDLNNFYSLLEAENYSRVRIKRNDFVKISEKFLKDFDVKLTENQKTKLGIFITQCITVSDKNLNHLYEALNRIHTKKKKDVERFQLINEKINTLKNTFVIQEATDKPFVKGDSYEELSDEAKRWHGKIKFIGLKSFKTVWFSHVKERSDIVYTDEVSNNGDIKYYINRPVFSVPEILLQQTKKQYKEFNPGLYEYLQFLMFHIERMKRKIENGYAIDNTIFCLTSATSIGSINLDNNFIAINTNGNDRPTFKGLPEFLTRNDFKKLKNNEVNQVALPFRPQGENTFQISKDPSQAVNPGSQPAPQGDNLAI